MEMQIRPYLETDEEAVVDLWRRCELVVPWNNPRSDIARKLAVDRDLFLVGLAGQRVVATVMGGYEGHRGWVNYLAVDPGSRRRGHGRRMMAALEERLRARGCPKINLQVRASNREVVAFYEALGFCDDRVMGFGKRLVTDDPFDG